MNKLLTMTLAALVLFAAAFIPAASASQSYTVKPGDTLTKIAKVHNVTVAQLKTWNSLKSDLLKTKQVLKVSGSTGNTDKKDSSLSITTVKTYKVKRGDTLLKVAKAYGTTVNQLKELNSLPNDLLKEGKVLKIPVPPAAVQKTSAFTPIIKDGNFPLPKGKYTPYTNNWGTSRVFGGDRSHEGIDIMANKGTPVYSATNGTIIRYGWNTLGGYRLTIKNSQGYNLYYAHFSKYAAGMANGKTVKKGQLIGYVGNSGYGVKGTTGKFAPHLHFSIYNSLWAAINPYNQLKHWEG